MGPRKNDFAEVGRRGTRLARNANAGIAGSFRVGVTPPGGMDRRPRLWTYSCAGPQGYSAGKAVKRTPGVRVTGGRRLEAGGWGRIEVRACRHQGVGKTVVVSLCVFATLW